MAQPRTLFDKIWDSHVITPQGEGTYLIYIDLHLIHEVTTPQAFEGLRAAGRKVRRPDATIAVCDHNIPTSNRSAGIDEPESKLQVDTLEQNVRDFGVPYFPINSINQGIVHIIGPEQGLSQPGMTIVCGDSHTATHGALGALAFGIGTSEVEHVLATQCLWQARPKTMEVRVDGKLGLGVTAKDLILGIIGRITTDGGTGHVIEYRGSAIEALSIEERMTGSNMSVAAGAEFERAAEGWLKFRTDDGARFDKSIAFDAAAFAPQVTWGTNPGMVVEVTGRVPDPSSLKSAAERQAVERALEYMGLQPGTAIQDIRVDRVFIGSCTNSRIGDLRAAADIVRGRKVAKGVHAMVVPGSQQVKAEAEKLGLDRVFVEAGFEWRESGCSMCLGMNPDILNPGERCASTSNRNFEGRQGKGGRTHLVSPVMAAAAAVAGHFVDVREWPAH